jgi:hypothetical protein
VVCEAAPLNQVRGLLHQLVGQSSLLAPEELKRLLKWAVPEYQPQLSPSVPGPVTPAPGQPLSQPKKSTGHAAVFAARFSPRATQLQHG